MTTSTFNLEKIRREIRKQIHDQIEITTWPLIDKYFRIREKINNNSTKQLSEISFNLTTQIFNQTHSQVTELTNQ
jgi:hypothetical protein